MTEHQKETAFLRQCILYDDTGERHQLEASITQLERNERCVRRAVYLMTLLVALAMAGLCYSAVCLSGYPQDMTQLMAQFISKVFCALGLGSLICLLAFVGLGVVHRNKLDQRRQECRRLATRVMESRLGKPRGLTETAPGNLAQRVGGVKRMEDDRNQIDQLTANDQFSRENLTANN